MLVLEFVITSAIAHMHIGLGRGRTTAHVQKRTPAPYSILESQLTAFWSHSFSRECTVNVSVVLYMYIYIIHTCFIGIECQ